MHANSFNNSSAGETIVCLEDSYTPIPTTVVPSIPYYYKMQMLCHPLHAEINLLFHALLQRAIHHVVLIAAAVA